MKYFYSRLFLFATLLPCGIQLSGQNLLLSMQVTPTSCTGLCNGSIDLTVSGGTPAYQYIWSTGATTQDQIGYLCDGTYTVTVTDANGLTQTSSATVTETPGITVSSCVTNPNCDGTFDGAIDLSVGGGTPPYTYLWWWNNSTTEDQSGLGPDVYFVIIHDAHGCSASANIPVNPPPPIIINSAVTNSNGSLANGTVDLSVSGGTPGYTYAWSNGNTTADLAGLSPGSYTVTVTDSKGCTRQHQVSILGVGGGGPTNPMLLNGTVFNSGCGLNCTGRIIIKVSNGTPPLGYTVTATATGGPSYSGTSLSDTFSLTQLCAGTYCIKVFNVAGTSPIVTACYTVGQGASQAINIQSSNAAFCNYNDGSNPPICEMVCPHTAVTYYAEVPVNCAAPPPNFQGANWTINGAESYTVHPDGKEVQVIWGESGPGQVSLSSANPDVCFESTRCITIVEEPKAKFSTEPAANPLHLCKGQTVTFKNESLDAEQFEWLFGDNLLSVSEENPQHTFQIPGNFTVTLIARSNCLCADTTILSVEVLDSEPPLLDCVGSVCPGETVTYTTSSACGSYSWAVSPHGTIMSGGNSNDPDITVQWNDGPAGSISLSAMGCGGAACPQASVFSIPIISDNAEIRGNESVCPESEEEYSINQFDGAEYVWTLSSGGNITSGQGTNKIAISWTAQADFGTTHWVSVIYNNCYLGCGGRDSIPVKILSPFFISGPVELCEKSSGQITAILSATAATILCDWSIIQENGAVFWSSAAAGSSINFPANAPAGKYRVRAIAANSGETCSPDADLILRVLAAPPQPGVISGPAVVCPGTAVPYEVLGNAPYSVQWTVFNGNPSASTGNPFVVNWTNNAPRWLSAVYVSTDGLGCTSDSTLLQISPVSGLPITGPPATCEGLVSVYNAEYYAGLEYQWEVIPAGAGAIKTGQGKNSVEIFWQTAGAHTLRLNSCGAATDYTVTVSPNPSPLLSMTEGVCSGDSNLVSTLTPYNDYFWQNADGTALSTASSVKLPAGSYAMQVTDDQGCSGSAHFKIDNFPTPNVSVTTADPTGFCNNSLFVSLTALVPNGTAFTYEWQHDGVPVGTNAPGYVTNQYGNYTVIVTNDRGCTATAPSVLLYSYCGGGGFGPPSPPVPFCPPGSIQAVPDPTLRCDSFDLVLNDFSGMYVSGSGQWWTGISGGTTVATGSGNKLTVVYPNAGKYIVILRALLQNGSICESIDSLEVGVAAQFSQTLACPGDSTHFTDESTRLPNAAITNWSWDFGEAGNTDVSSMPSPAYPYAGSGNYSATLTITSASGCTSSHTETVFVPDAPSPGFSPPLANCAGNATAFTLASTAGIIKTAWDFGDPASGALNESTGNPVYHNYSPSGDYAVAITAINTYGCRDSAIQTVTITDNPFTGAITPINPIICEGQSVTLTAPAANNATYVWSNGSNMPTLPVSQEGVYDVTLSNGNGCTFSPPAAAVDVNPAPVGTIKALEINDVGQIIGVIYPSLSVCYGADVNLQIQDNGSYTYEWSGGNGDDEILVFSEDRGTQLNVGTYTYTVTVTNSVTGCTSVLPPFDVTVNPQPSGFTLSSNSFCSGTPSVINYSGPQPPEWQIFWNTGEVGPALTTDDAGLYFVRVVNEFGCAAQSNTVVIFPGPRITALPSGCHERCNPDTLCIPVMPDIVSWQWFLEGTALPGATGSQLIATQSGAYYAELVDTNGCHAQSALLNLNLYNGFGNIEGQVWSDVNDNGIIDAADTLVALIPVQLTQNGSVLNSGVSGQNGNFEWLNVFSSGYNVQVDTQALNPQWVVVIPNDSVQLSGCGGRVFADLLIDVAPCVSEFSSLELMACPGASATYNGLAIPTGQSQDFTLKNAIGCDSIVTVTVNPLPVNTSAFSTSICPGSTYLYEGVNLSVGQTQAFTLTNALGCDSIVTVMVGALPQSASSLNPSICPGSSYLYEGVNLSVGQTQAFTLTNALGCDSIVTVTVGALPQSASTLNPSICPGSSYLYEGVNLSVGQTQAFTLTNALGCDSIVTVTVGTLPLSASLLNPSICPGSTYLYEGVNLSVGQTQAFTLTNALGCDSIVTVTVGAFPLSTSSLNPGICPGSTYLYEGVNLLVGQTQAFTLTNALGCDSIVTVTVGALPVNASAFNPRVCPGSTYLYEGVNLSVGQTQAFTLANALGCDSIVTVTVGALQVNASTFNPRVCPGSTYLYEGVNLAVGQTQAFTLMNAQGCDSVVTVTVFEKTSSSEVREITVCPGETHVFNGETLFPGQIKDFHFDNTQGCDSLIRLKVLAFPAFDYTVSTDNSCPAGNTGALDVSVSPGGSVVSAYALNGGAFQSGPSFTALEPGNYVVSVKDINGCVYEQTANIEASPNLQVELPGAFVIPCDHDMVTLAPVFGGDTSGLAIDWWNGAHTTSVATAEAGPVWLEASNHCEERVRREADVQWADANGEAIHIYVPNIFAPEAKNVENSMFRAFFGDNFSLLSYRLEVFDRWGNKLFESEQPELGWTGDFRNRIMEPGVYAWQMWVKLAFCNREMELYRKGDVTVER